VPAPPSNTILETVLSGVTAAGGVKQFRSSEITLAGIVIVFSFLQKPKARDPIFVIPLGIKTDAKLSHEINISLAISRISEESETLCKDLQFSKTRVSMVVTLLGNSICCNGVVLNARSSILVNLQFSANSTSVSPLCKNVRLLIVSTFAGIEIDVNNLQLTNASSPITVTLSGIEISDNREQPLKALSPILVSLSGRMIDFKDQQPLKAPSSIRFKEVCEVKVISSKELHPEKAYLKIIEVD
jgi:hypothetical protein